MSDLMQQRLAQARAALEVFAEYEWLLQAGPCKCWWNVPEVAAAQNVPESTVRRWCRDGKILEARNYGKRAGWHLPKTGLILFFGSYYQEAGDVSS